MIDLFKRYSKGAFDINGYNFEKIISNNSSTLFGKNHSFSSIQSPVTYKRNVRISNDISAYIASYENGVKNALTNYSVLYSPLTREKGMRYLLTDETLKRYCNIFKSLEKALGSGSCFHLHTFKQEYDLSDALYMSMIESGYLNSSNIAGSMHCLLHNEEENSNYLSSRVLLSLSDITSIAAPSIKKLYFFFKYITDNIDMLLFDAVNGGSSVKLSAEGLRVAEQIPLITRKRADEIRKILTFYGRVKNLFPSLSYVIASDDAEKEALDFFLRDTPIYYSPPISDGTIFAIPVAANRNEYILFSDGGYYEFMLGRSILDLEEIEIGMRIRPVVTNFSGYYRYPLSVNLIVSDFYESCPIFVIDRETFSANI